MLAAERLDALPGFDDTLIRAALRVDHHINHGRPITAEEMETGLAQYREEWRAHKMNGGSAPFVPSTLEVDRIWHAHMCVPQQYVTDCNEYFGFLLEHSAPKCIMALIG